MIEITTEELLEKLDGIMDDYSNGDDTHYRVVMDDGRAVMLTPYDGPYEETVKQLPDGDLYVEIPNRIIAKQGWSEKTNLNMEVVDGNIQLTEVKGG